MIVMSRLLIVLVVAAHSFSAMAQTPPDANEIAGYDGLHKAAHSNDIRSIRKLVAAGAGINARDQNNRTAAHVAAFASNDEALAALAEAGADMNALEGGRYDVVTIAAVANDPELVSLAIELGNKPGLTTSVYDGTALIAAAHLGHHEVVRRLINGGAPLDHINNLGWTALIEAVILGDGGQRQIKTVEVLVGAGADIAIADRDGTTPLEHAQSRGYIEIAAIISNAGAPD